MMIRFNAIAINTKVLSILLLGFLLIMSDNAKGEKRLSLEFLPGGAMALPAPLNIYQEGEPDLSITAFYHTQSLKLPIYYSWRIRVPLNEKATIGMELNHLKIYLYNMPLIIDRFTITHGYNQLWFNYTRHFLDGVNILLGIGPVIAHPESTIRGLTLDESKGIAGRGYYIAGISSQLAVQKKFNLGKHLFLSIETKFNAAYTEVDVVNGYATVSVYAIHWLGGFGVQF